jgi:hypothetical protein
MRILFLWMLLLLMVIFMLNGDHEVEVAKNLVLKSLAVGVLQFLCLCYFFSAGDPLLNFTDFQFESSGFFQVLSDILRHNVQIQYTFLFSKPPTHSVRWGPCL